MRSTSSERKSLALFLSFVLVLLSAVPASVRGSLPPEPALLIKVSSTSIPADAARVRLEAIGAAIGARLRVRWVPPGSPGAPPAEEEPFPVADGEDLARISGKLEEAMRRMEGMETGPAEEILSEALRLARSFRFGDTMRPYVAEIFLRKGLLYLWKGETGKSEDMLSRSRALRPDFSPDPGLFSPPFLEAWNRSGERALPEAELLVNSIPPGARVHVNGREEGVTPCRVRIRQWAAVHVRVSADGYRTGGRTGQWLPGDFEEIGFILVREDTAALAELLSSSPDGKESGPLLSRMLRETGAGRVALLMLEGGDEGETLRVLSQEQGEGVPKALGTIPWPAGEEGIEEAGASAAEMLANAGWPRRDDPSGKLAPWYGSWMFWAVVGVAAAGIAVGMGGGGGSGGGGTGTGSATGTIGVDF